ncbi:hypothetical protein ACS3YM_07290 [Nocardia sp. N13]|uniref:hypothetical protein n=1 Tax=Nocardioides sp. N13(2025) TaxID=3453405 RepID=UPI003F7746BB
MVTQSVIVLWLASDTWFGGDDWHYILFRGTVPKADMGLLEPWGGHWQATIILIYRALIATVGLQSHVPYLVVIMVAHLFVTLFTWLILRRHGIRPWTATVIAWLVLFYGSGAQAFASTGPMPLTVGMAVGLGALLVWLHGEGSRRTALAAAALLVLGVMTSAAGVVACLLVAMVVYFRKGVRAAALVAGPAFVAFGTWYAVQGRDAGRIHVAGWSWTDLPEFAFKGVTAALGEPIAMPATGGFVLLAVILCCLLLRGVGEDLRILALCGIMAAFAQMTLSGLGALSLDLDPASQSRYLYLSFILMAPALGLVLDGLSTVAAGRIAGSPGLVQLVRGVALLALLAYTLVGLQGVRRDVDLETAIANVYKSWAYGSAAGVLSGQKVLSPHPDVPLFEAHDMTLMTEPEVLDLLPPRSVDQQWRVDDDNQFFTKVGEEVPGLFNPVLIGGEGFTTQFRAQPGCKDYTAQALSDPLITLGTGQQGVEIGVVSESTTVTTTITREGVTSSAKTWSVEPGPIYVSTTARDAVLRVSFNGDGDFSICHQ